MKFSLALTLFMAAQPALAQNSCQLDPAGEFSGQGLEELIITFCSLETEHPDLFNRLAASVTASTQDNAANLLREMSEVIDCANILKFCR